LNLKFYAVAGTTVFELEPANFLQNGVTFPAVELVQEKRRSESCFQGHDPA